MKTEHLLYLTMVKNGMDVKQGTVDSIKEAVDLKQIHFFSDNEGLPIGFVTWYFEGGCLIVNNLVILKEKRGFKNLFILRKMFHRKYPELKKVKWSNDKRKRVFESRFEKEKIWVHLK